MGLEWARYMRIEDRLEADGDTGTCDLNVVSVVNPACANGARASPELKLHPFPSLEVTSNRRSGSRFTLGKHESGTRSHDCTPGSSRRR